MHNNYKVTHTKFFLHEEHQIYLVNKNDVVYDTALALNNTSIHSSLTLAW